MGKPKLGVFKFASCDGCQLSLLDAEDQLLAVADAVEIRHFPEASSRMEAGPYDIALVEGSITTPHDAERIQQIRRDAKFLMTIGACATSGGIQALRNGADTAEFMRAVYASPEYIQVLDKSTPIAEHVKVDFELRGCPINQYQLIEVIQSLLAGRNPRTPRHSVCLDCKRRGTVCVTVAQGTPCLGPVTQSGCNAICPSYHRGCYGCYGPAAQPNLVSLSTHALNEGASAAEVSHNLRNFNVYAPAFRNESQRLTDQIKEQN
ncbi:oxidoreductase [uncultured Gimesia sp.]|uniref:NADH-quinone oxidoreductase subunit B family protein n=1 Tax=uncultured Gimesia sp. TaxID=1678688 RepID=UPI0026084672|nr:oxidoreductase [uncultured Gimesia sp.]